MTEWVRKFICPKNCQVWLWRVTDIVKCIQETVVHFCHTVTTIISHTCHRRCDEGWVTWVELIVCFCTSKFYSTKFQDEVINKFLDFWFCESTTSKVAFCINVKNDWHTSKRSSSTIYDTADSHESDIHPLDSFFYIHCRSTNIKSVKVTQANNFFQWLVLKVDFFAKTNSFFINVCQSIPIFDFFCHQVICTVKSKTCVNTNDTSTWISIWQTCYSVCVTCTTDICCVGTENTVIYSCYVFCEDFMHLRIWFIAMFLQSSFRHTDTTFWHEV